MLTHTHTHTRPLGWASLSRDAVCDVPPGEPCSPSHWDDAGVETKGSASGCVGWAWTLASSALALLLVLFAAAKSRYSCGTARCLGMGTPRYDKLGVP